MYRVLVFINLLFVSAFGFAQQGSAIRITGRIPGATDSNLYQIQVGAFSVHDNAQRAFDRLKDASMKPVFEKYQNLIRVMVAGIKAGDVPLYIEKIRNAGFPDIFIRIDTGNYPVVKMPDPPPVSPAPLPVSTEAVPYDDLVEIYEDEDIPIEVIPDEVVPQQSFFIWRSAGQPPRTIIMNRAPAQKK